MELLGGRPVWSMSGGERLATLDRLDAELARLETYRLEVIAGLDDIGYASEIGAHDTAQLLEYRYRLDRSRARRDLRLARSLGRYGAVSTALHTNALAPEDSPDGVAMQGLGGEAPEVLMHPAQAEAIVSALDRVPVTVPVDHIDVAERELVNLARHLGPADLRRAGERIRDLLDTDGPEPEEHKAYARESLTLTTADRGVKFRGYLANENAELLRSLVFAGARPHKTTDGAQDPRPREKRQADALTTALTVAATAWDTTTTGRDASHPAATTGRDTDAWNSPRTGLDAALPLSTQTVPAESAATCTADPSNDRVPGFGAKANITVTIDLQDLKAAAADNFGEVVYGDGLSAAAIRRMACDAKIIPLVLGSNSEPLDVGRCERLVTRAMRRALNTRDRGCVVCGAPPIMCDAHHVISWIDGGETKVTNLALLCRRHHIDLHAGDWTITITNGTVHVSRPTWTNPPSPHHQPPAHHPPTPAPHRPPAASSRNHPTPDQPPPDVWSSNQHAPAQRPQSSRPSYERAAGEGAPDYWSSNDRGADQRPQSSRPSYERAADEATPDCWSSDEHVSGQVVPDPRSRGEGVPDQLTPDDQSPDRLTPDRRPTAPGAPINLLAPGTIVRRSALGRQLLQRVLAEPDQDATTVAASLREAASLAIWGEPTTPSTRLSTPRATVPATTVPATDTTAPGATVPATAVADNASSGTTVPGPTVPATAVGDDPASGATVSGAAVSGTTVPATAVGDDPASGATVLGATSTAATRTVGTIASTTGATATAATGAADARITIDGGNAVGDASFATDSGDATVTCTTGTGTAESSIGSSGTTATGVADAGSGTVELQHCRQNSPPQNVLGQEQLFWRRSRAGWFRYRSA